MLRNKIAKIASLLKSKQAWKKYTGFNKKYSTAGCDSWAMPPPIPQFKSQMKDVIWA